MIDSIRLHSLLAELENHSAAVLETGDVKFLAWESERTRFYRRLSEIVVGLANSAGGTIIAGIRPDGQGNEAVVGCADVDSDELRRSVHQETEPGILVSVSEHLLNGKTLLVIDVPQGIPPHSLKSPRPSQFELPRTPSPPRDKTEEGVGSREGGVEHVEAEIADPRRLAPIERSGPNSEFDLRSSAFIGGFSSAEDFSARLLDAGEEAVDPLEVERLRNVLLAKEPSSSLLRLPNNELLKALGILRGDGTNGTDRSRLTVAGLLMVGREAALKDKLPGHETVYLHMAKETEYDRRVDYRRPLLAVLDDLAQQIELHNRLFTLKVGLFQFEIPDYPPEVYREALLNAFLHRDYASLNPVYIRLYGDRLEVASPGGLLGGITSLNIMSHEPVTRNRLLGEILQKLRLVERSGMGVRRMFTIQLSYGKEPPLYAAAGYDVRVILRSGKADEPFARFIAKRQQQGEEFSLNELIVLAYLKRNQEIDLQEATRILQRSSYESHEALSAMVRRELLEPFGQKKGRVYRLSKAIYTELRQSVEYHLHRDAEFAYAEAAITNYIRKNGFITNQVVRTLLRVNKSQSSYLLHKLVKAGKLVLQGHGKATKYVSGSREEGSRE